MAAIPYTVAEAFKSGRPATSGAFVSMGDALYSYALKLAHHEGGATVDEDDLNEAYTLRAFLAEIVGMGGDEQWRGDWYPTGLIRDSYFEDYARELADDIGAIDRHAQWPTNHIDWKSAAEALQEDYTSAVLDGVTYWMR